MAIWPCRALRPRNRLAACSVIWTRRLCAPTRASSNRIVLLAPVRSPRLWTKPSVTVIGFDAHPVEGSFNVISPETTFRLSLRTAPNQRPEEAQEALAKFMVEHAPFGAEVWVDKLDNGMGWAMDPNAEATKDAMDAMEEAFGVAPVNKGEGGSIPFIPELQRIFPKAQVLVTGPEDPKANAHSPNESISLPALKNNVITEALLLDKLAK